MWCGGVVCGVVMWCMCARPRATEEVEHLLSMKKGADARASTYKATYKVNRVLDLAVASSINRDGRTDRAAKVNVILNSSSILVS